MANNWIHSSPYAPLPPNAVVGGFEADGSPIYVGRCFHEGDNLPTKVIPAKRQAFIAWGGAEHAKDHYQLLVGDNYSWQPCSAADIPPNAVSSGKTSSGEPLYIGRGHYANSLVVGKVQPSHGCLYIPHEGAEVKVEKYEILVYGGGVDISTEASAPNIENFEGHKWVHSSAYSNMPPLAVVGGNDYDGDMMYVGRAFHEGDMLVTKIIPAKRMAFASWRGTELPKDHFEVLCGRNLVWRHCYNHQIPDNAVSCGTTSLDQAVYIGRGHYEGSLSVGRISKVHRALFIPFKGVERRLETYEILVEEKLNSCLKLEVCSDPLPPPPPPMPPTPESACPLPVKEECPYPVEKEKSLGLGFLEIKPAMPMPMPAPVGPPPPYTLLAPVAPVMPTPATVYPPFSVSGSMPTATIQPAETYQPSPAYSYVPPPPPQPASYYPGYTPAATAPAAGSYDIWQSAPAAFSPSGAVYAGQDSDMSGIYVCRAYHNGECIPGKAIPSRAEAFVSYQGQEIYKPQCELLIGSHYMWVPAVNGYAPGAVEAGRTVSGEILYVGRVPYMGSMTCGKIHRSHGCLYIPYSGREVRIDGGYEILVNRNQYYNGAACMY